LCEGVCNAVTHGAGTDYGDASNIHDGLFPYVSAVVLR
jgi:hypothetical protein